MDNLFACTSFYAFTEKVGGAKQRMFFAASSSPGYRWSCLCQFSSALLFPSEDDENTSSTAWWVHKLFVLLFSKSKIKLNIFVSVESWHFSDRSARRVAESLSCAVVVANSSNIKRFLRRIWWFHDENRLIIAMITHMSLKDGECTAQRGSRHGPQKCQFHRRSLYMNLWQWILLILHFVRTSYSMCGYE